MAEPLSVRPLELDPVRQQLESYRERCYSQLFRTQERGLAGKIPPKQVSSVAVGLKALALILERIHPVPKAEVNVSTSTAPIVIQWDTSQKEIAPPGDRSAPSSGFLNGSSGSTFWSAIEDGERPPSA